MMDVIKMLDYRLAAENGERILVKRLEEKEKEVTQKLASARKLMMNLQFVALTVMFLAGILVVADLTVNKGGSGASLVGLVLLCEACGVELAYSVWKKRVGMVVGWAVLNVGFMALLVLLVGAVL